MDPALAEQVATSLVTRAQDLYDAREPRDAKQLAVEAVVTSPAGPAADRARALIHRINVQLGIPEDEPLAPPPVTPPVTPPPALQAATPQPDADKPSPERSTPRSRRITAQVHAGLYTGLLGATIGSSFASDDYAAPSVLVGLGAGAAGAAFLAPVLDRNFDEAQLRTIGSGTVWGGVIGGLFADITTGTGVGSSGTSPRQVLIGASIGATVGAAGGYGLARQKKLTRGDVALVDTLTGIGTWGGLTVGMLMQPAQSEAYDVNAVIGATGGIIAGLVAANKTNTTPRRMLKVAEYAAIGGAAPFVLYAVIYDSNSSADERITGALSTLGLVGGAWLGFRKTAHMDLGQDVPEDHVDAPPAVVGRSSDGSWQLGAPALVPLSPQLDNHQRGAGLSVLSARF